uniref:Uncharacterized protein n=1 Tax=Anguilla anguilla TaxID=7936 RepID=A0A0E9UV49_ANGAN
MRRSAVSVWMGRPTSSCPALTASVRNASTNEAIAAAIAPSAACRSPRPTSPG